MRRFEYKVIRYLKEYTVRGHETRDLPYLEDLVNQLGDEGWELVTWHEHQTEFLLKREKAPRE
jgi:hypothetical protein